jgi:MYXO-CTERM domain-containing protein
MLRYALVLPLVLVGLALVPSTALAVEVECSNEDGTCTVSNDGSDSVDCECDMGGSSGTTGGNDWSGLDEDEMEMVCGEQLELCGGGDTTFGTADTGSFTDSATTSPPTTSVGTVTTDPSDTTDSATTDGPDTTGSSSDSESESDTTTGGPDLTTTGGEPDTTGGPVDTTGSPDSMSASASATVPNDDDETGDTEDTAPDETTTEPSGCGCTTTGRGSGWAFALGFVGLLGLRRRR